MKPVVLILDVDGVLTDGKFYYTVDGKYLKAFGPDDSDALGILDKLIEIRFVTGDKKGFEISKKRIVDDMGYKLDLVSTINRLEWMKKKYNLDEIIFIGDGIFDYIALKEVGYSIVTSNGDSNSKKYADFITKRSGGDRAVAEAVIHILEKFFDGFDYNKKVSPEEISGEWSK
tara:strand:- start:45 stop:563 length:519 start_codon:yes stop_codon:yes gene_type:complete